jgi:hypothetical protein
MPSVDCSRRSGRTRRLAAASLVVAASAALLGCSGPSPAPNPSPKTEAPPCSRASVVATFSESAIRVRNLGPSCRLAGTEPVAFAYWHPEGSLPVADRTVLASGATYVQPFRVVAKESCDPVPDHAARVAVRFEGQTVMAAGRLSAAYVIRDCSSQVPGSPRVEP